MRTCESDGLKSQVSADRTFVVLQLWYDGQERVGEGRQKDMRETGEAREDEDARCRGGRGRGDDFGGGRGRELGRCGDEEGESLRCRQSSSLVVFLELRVTASAHLEEEDKDGDYVQSCEQPPRLPSGTSSYPANRR